MTSHHWSPYGLDKEAADGKWAWLWTTVFANQA
jgi:hypothetical protein